MRVSFSTLFVLMVASAAGFAAQHAPVPIDFVDYFLQTDDTKDQWTLGGTDVHEMPDPDGTGMRTIVLNKWSEPGVYEVMKVTDADVQIRYEVVREPEKNEEMWIRRYHEEGATDLKAGAVWSPRFVVPGKTTYLSHFSQDRFTFDRKTRQWVLAPGSAKDQETFLSLDFATIDWDGNNKTGFELNPALRLTSEWQREGLMFETYDYVKGKGLVNWRWMERVSTLSTAKELGPDVFHCEEGYVQADTTRSPPRVWKFDATTRKRGRLLEVILFQSHWKPEMGKQYYVVYRDLSKEEALKKKFGRVVADFKLPEWAVHPDATIADLPPHFTK